MSSIAVTDKAHEKVSEEVEGEMYNKKQLASKVLTAYCEEDIEVDIFEE